MNDSSQKIKIKIMYLVLNRGFKNIASAFLKQLKSVYTYLLFHGNHFGFYWAKITKMLLK